MTEPDPTPSAPTGSTRIRVAITACLAVIAVLLGALVVRTFVGGDDGRSDDRVVKIDEMVGSGSERSGAPDVDEMLDTVIREADGTATSLRDQLGDTPLVVNLW